MTDAPGTNRLEAVSRNQGPLLADELNTNQLEAYRWGRGPLLVLAGPGSGKTKVLTHRIARLVGESAGQNFRILGLTFTNKAATEMRKRVNDLVPDADRRINITTYHSFSAAILRQHGHHLGIRPDFVIMTQDAERRAVLDEAIAEAGLAHVEGYDTGRLLSIITKLTERNVLADSVSKSLDWARPDTARQIEQVYGRYRGLMIKHGGLDFGGLVAEALRLLTRTAAGRMIRRIYPYVCVDEFQDTNDAQYQLLCSVVDPDTRNLFVVADDNQTIYEWNGARQERVGQIQRHFGMTVCELPENYRCPPNVVSMANRLIARNPSHDSPESVSNKPQGRDHPVKVMGFDTAEEEANWVAGDIAARPAKSRQNCAVLARTRSSLERVIAALKERNIHGHLPNRMDRFVDDRMVWLHSVLRLANSRQDGRQLRQICKSFYTLEGVDLIADNITSEAVMAEDKDFLRAWNRAALREELNPTTRSFLSDGMPKLIDRLDAKSFVQDCFAWFEKRQSEDPAPDYDTRFMDEKRIWDALESDIEREVGREQVTLSTLLQQIDLRPKERRVPRGSIRCYTIFASKGLGFDHVYLVGLAEGELPDWRAVNEGDESREMQEERRICFVAITRSQESLTMTYSLRMSGSARERSRFLNEMGAGSGSAS